MSVFIHKIQENPPLPGFQNIWWSEGGFEPPNGCLRQPSIHRPLQASLRSRYLTAALPLGDPPRDIVSCRACENKLV